MDKFNSIIKEFKMRTDTSFPYTYTATKWDKPITPITPNSQNASINRVSNVTTNISEPEYKEVYFPPSQWNDSDIAEFLAKLLEGNMLGAMGKLINDPSIETILNEDQMKNTLQVPLDTIISSVGNMSGMITNDANIATSNINSQVASESNVPQDGNDITPDLSPTKNLIGNTQAYDPKQPVSMPSSNNQPGAASDPKTAEAQQLGSIIEQAKLITEKIKGLFTEQTIITALANLETIFGDGEKAVKKTNRDTKKIRKAIEEAAIQDNWQDSLRELSSSFSGIQQPVSTPATESFNRIINDYINLNRLDEVAPVAALGLAALGGSIISIMVKYFIASTAI